MIKNYDIVKKTENIFLRENVLSPQETLSRANEMYEFAMKYKQDGNVPPEDSQHIQSLIKMSKLFLQYGNALK